MFFGEYDSGRATVCWSCLTDLKDLPKCPICNWMICPKCGMCRKPQYGKCVSSITTRNHEMNLLRSKYVLMPIEKRPKFNTQEFIDWGNSIIRDFRAIKQKENAVAKAEAEAKEKSQIDNLRNRLCSGETVCNKANAKGKYDSFYKVNQFEYVRIKFESGIKEYVFPDSFAKGFLKFDKD